MNEIFEFLMASTIFKVVVFLACFDIFVGLLRCIKERKINSAVGIDGMIRKIGMIGAIAFLEFLSMMFSIDLKEMIPSDLLAYLPFNKISPVEFFGLGFILYEILSILKNLVRIGNPVNNKLIRLIENLLNKYTGELDKEKLK